MSATPVAARTGPQEDTVLHGPWLKVARFIAFAVIGLSWLVFMIGVGVGYQRFSAVIANLEPTMMKPYIFLLDLVMMCVSTAVAGLILWKKSDAAFSLFVAVTLVTFGASGTTLLQHLYAQSSGVMQFLAYVVNACGLCLILIFLYVFPSGKCVPQWTRIASLVWIGWFIVLPALESVNPSIKFAVIAAAYFSGVAAQVIRRRRITDPIERQQTKWAFFGLTIAFTFFFFATAISVFLSQSSGQQAPNTTTLRFVGGLAPTFSAITILIIPVTVGISMLRFRLWDIDPLVNRTVVYGAMTIGLGALFFAEVVVFQAVFRSIIGRQSDIAIVASTLIIASLVQPARRRLQNMVDRRFYREKVDAQKAFTEFSREIRTILDLQELMQALVSRVTELMHITYGAVFLRKEGANFVLSDRRTLWDMCNLAEREEVLKVEPLSTMILSSETIQRLQTGHTIIRPKDVPFVLLVPLIAPRGKTTELVGVLALGVRRSGQGYSREDQALLHGLADQAGTAIYVAHLIQEQREEANRRQEAERALEARRNSPIGRAEAFAQKLVAHPETALVSLHQLAIEAETDPDQHSLFINLPKVADVPDAAPVARLAEGFQYLYQGLHTPELVSVGLRILISELQRPPVSEWRDAIYPLTLFQLCQELMSVRSIPQITQHMLNYYDKAQQGMLGVMADMAGAHSTEDLRDIISEKGDLLASPRLHLVIAVLELREVSELLYDYERVDTPQDKLSYLVSAFERLSRVDRSARADLNGPDRAVILRILEIWIGIVRGAMSELQTRAQIVPHLLTRHTWHDDVISLVLNVTNDGRGAALNIRVSLAASPEYTVIESALPIERLAPDEEVQIELKVRPRLAEGIDQFRARFIVQYDDPRGSDQVDNFADVVQLLTHGAEFQFIPNPYVVGTPLQVNSPLFFGRQDVVQFVHDNLSAAHRNNLVLIGQRRTGKTSLLKQLPARLGDDYLPVYLDGQALGLDPGMANFFLNLATEIAFAMEDRGLTPPEVPDFSDNPATTFERVFLAQVRQCLGDRHLLILFDEFEELESAVRRGNLDPAIFGFLRHLIQHGEKVSTIFCGTHRMEELASEYWNVLFNMSLYRDIGYLSRTEAVRLIQEPVAKHGMRYDDLAIDKMWRVTAGHPYFLQLLCHSLVNRHNRTQRNYITVADVNAALDEILASGEAHFVYLWNESTPTERLALTALSRMMPLTGSATSVQVTDYLCDRGHCMERQPISEAMHRLNLRDILTMNNETETADTYRWRLGLICLWVEKYKSLSRVADEVA